LDRISNISRRYITIHSISLVVKVSGVLVSLYPFNLKFLTLSLGIDFAQAFWGLLLPHGFSGGALTRVPSRDGDNDDKMDGDEGFKEEYMQWWFEFLNKKGHKGVSKDTWVMVRCFLLLILNPLPFNILSYCCIPVSHA